MFGQGSTRIRTTEFFGIVLPGFFVLLQLSLLLLLFPGVVASIKSSIGDKTNIPDMVDKVWAPALVLLLFISYIIGSVFRARRMRLTDVFCYELFHAYRPDTKKRAPEKTIHFPYVESLRNAKMAVFEAIPENIRLGLNYVTDIPPFGLAPDPEHDETWWKDAYTPEWWMGEPIFGFWKARLCNCENASVFDFAQTAESRTRFFGGMMWAARWSLKFMFLFAACLVVNDILTRGLYPSDWLVASSIAIVAWVAFLIWEIGIQPRLGKTKPKDETKAAKRSYTWWRVAVRSHLFVEVIGTAIFLLAAARSSYDGWTIIQIFTVSALAALSAILFWFMGKRLREARNAELRAVYLNYCAMVLEKKFPNQGFVTVHPL